MNLKKIEVTIHVPFLYDIERLREIASEDGEQLPEDEEGLKEFAHKVAETEFYNLDLLEATYDYSIKVIEPK